MGKKLTMKLLAEEMESLRQRLFELEQGAERTLGRMADGAAHRVRQFVGPGTIDHDTRERLVRELAFDKSLRRGDEDPVSHWLEAEQDVDRVLRSLDLHP
jgi:hypothetical protein